MIDRIAIAAIILATGILCGGILAAQTANPYQHMLATLEVVR